MSDFSKFPQLTRKPTKETASEDLYSFMRSMERYYGFVPGDDGPALCLALYRPRAAEPYDRAYFDYDAFGNEYVGKYAPAETDACGVLTRRRDGSDVWSCSRLVEDDCAEFALERMEEE